MSPTPVLVEVSGTPNSDDASHPASIDNSATLKTVPLYNEYPVTTSTPPSQPLHPSPTASDPSTILAILQFVGVAATAVCQATDKAIGLEPEERYALKELRKGVDSLNSDTLVYKVLLNSMENDTDLGNRSSYTCFIQRYVMGLRSSSFARRANTFTPSQTGRKGSNGTP